MLWITIPSGRIDLAHLRTLHKESTPRPTATTEKIDKTPGRKETSSTNSAYNSSNCASTDSMTRTRIVRIGGRCRVRAICAEWKREGTGGQRQRDGRRRSC